jgi:hypothetical protein
MNQISRPLDVNLKLINSNIPYKIIIAITIARLQYDQEFSHENVDRRKLRAEEAEMRHRETTTHIMAVFNKRYKEGIMKIK